MNVTLRIDDEIGKAAKHMAVDEGMSLSKWVAELIKKEIGSSNPEESLSVFEALHCPELEKYEKENNIDFEFERTEMDDRVIEF